MEEGSSLIVEPVESIEPQFSPQGIKYRIDHKIPDRYSSNLDFIQNNFL